MQANRILPDLQASLLCEDVRQEVTGNFIFLGVIAVVAVPQLPVTANRLCVVTGGLPALEILPKASASLLPTKAPCCARAR